jgi:hypothetical protein
MLWEWRYPDKKDDYPDPKGSPYRNSGLTAEQMDRFYTGLVGLRSHPGVKGSPPGAQSKNIRHVLHWSPVIVIVSGGDKNYAHAVVIDGFDEKNTYRILDPSGTLHYNFFEEGCARDSINGGASFKKANKYDKTILSDFIWYW